ncbi:hypothetical protein [Saccharothrix algeriensis]|uniref:Uncharacterized protein n=1 Tax=Saccharothrix algeriensis TaxID=173560 RepID=A0A8T8I4E9_9PSEU|nr:hypothetical protein [Saccharothrix algeriensis]MBM7812080.1 hypothetical protein [Saccharothrix algeriensis]QTR05753.1 hypothetical protein J7S33_15195 [Saccharothrix algeriensis]
MFHLTVDAPDGAVATDMLIGELVRGARVDARRAPAAPPPGAKSGAGMAISELLLNGAVPAAVAAAVASVVTAFVQRGSARKVVIRSGEESITVQGGDARTQRALVADWLAKHGAPTGEG